ncbi:MAG: 1-acyl-sn-glycerol-3-phosphate acyltransferase [Planctomycetes bacterium]|nr:1-acyl-sn-glycerol-3-phosphate acyltransferase [Planctomycetota bacterium]
MSFSSESVLGGADHLLRLAMAGLTVGLYTLLSPFGYTFFALLYLLPTRDPLARTRRLQAVTAWAFRFMHDWLRALRLTDFDPRLALRDVPPGPKVVVANHPTLMDVTSIAAALGGGVSIAKPTLFRRRSLAPIMRGAGHVEGPGRDPLSARRALDDAVTRLEQGFTLIIFPEGTRSHPGMLHPFSRAAFEIACRARVPVVSVAITCEPVWLSKEVPLRRVPRAGVPVLRLATLAVDDPADVDFSSRRLGRRVEERFQHWLAATVCDRPVPPSEPSKDASCPTTPSKSA